MPLDQHERRVFTYFSALIFATTLFSSRAVEAYEVVTHAAITREAIARSRLGSDTNLLPPLLPQLGLDKRPYLFGNIYLDINGNQVLPRNRFTFELTRMALGGIQPSSAIASWIATGAIRE